MDGEESDYEIAVQDTDATVPTLRRLTEQSEETLGYQIDTLSDIDDKALRIYRANILLLSVVIGGLSIAVQNNVPNLGHFISINTGFGILFLLVSIASAGVTYTSSDLLIGIPQSAIVDTLKENYTEKDILLRLSKGYGKWLNYNDDVLKENGELITYTIIFSVDALAFLSSGVFFAAAGIQGFHLLSSQIILILISIFSFLLVKIFIFPSVQISYYSIATLFLVGIGVCAIHLISSIQTALITVVSVVAQHIIIVHDILLLVLVSAILLVSNYWIFHMDY